ncbi:hypothetical protein IPJ72_02950 [Candidatus Peregrinibacteria bacterium]|nr:MAG: hypothetical protein IPJ72_02950 [Candidatus Peregrinibacteria bacterium]
MVTFKAKHGMIALVLLVVSSGCSQTQKPSPVAESTLRPLTNELNRYTNHQQGFFMDVPQKIFIGGDCKDEQWVKTAILEADNEIHIVPEHWTDPADCTPIQTTLENYSQLPQTIPTLSLKAWSILTKCRQPRW